MRKLLVVIGFSLLVAGASLAGGGNFDDMPQQQMAPQGKVVVVAPPSDNTGAYIAAMATVVAAGLGYLGVRQARKKD
jgi:hypothetical protein